MTSPVSDYDRPVSRPAHARSLHELLDRLRREARKRWDWYRQQQREDEARPLHWWDVYNR